MEQAEGVLAERNNLHMEQAFQALRRDARDHNEKLTDVADNVVEGGDIDPGPHGRALPDDG